MCGSGNEKRPAASPASSAPASRTSFSSALSWTGRKLIKRRMIFRPVHERADENEVRLAGAEDAGDAAGRFSFPLPHIRVDAFDRLTLSRRRWAPQLESH